MVFLGIERKNATPMQAGRCKRPRSMPAGRWGNSAIPMYTKGPLLGGCSQEPLPGLQYMDCRRKAGQSGLLYLSIYPGPSFRQGVPATPEGNIGQLVDRGKCEGPRVGGKVKSKWVGAPHVQSEIVEGN